MKLDVYLERIRPYAKGCPDQVIKNYLIVTLRDICHRANLWRYHDKLYMVKGIKDYTLTTPANTEIATVQNIQREDGSRLQSRDLLPPYISKGTPYYYRHFETTALSVAPIPDKDQMHDIELTLMPAFSATEVPDDVGNLTIEFACWGVLADLQMMPDEPWTNPQLSEVNRQKYERELNKKRIRGLVGVSGGEQSVTRRRFI